MPNSRFYLEEFVSVLNTCVHPQVNWSHPLGRGLVAAWLFSEGGGSSIRNLRTGAPATIANGTWVGYQRGSCLSFNGTSTQVPLTTSISDSSWPIINFTVEIWFKKAANATTNTLLDVGLTSGGWTISITAANLYQFGKGTNIGTSTQAVAVDTWEHAVITFNGLTATLYVNGQLSISGNLAGAFTAPAGGSRIGASGTTPVNWYGGQMGMMRIWERILPDDAVFDAYTNPFDFLAQQELSAHRHLLLGQQFIRDNVLGGRR